jgi:uncharacterized protein (TIGR00369 family)
MRSKSEQLALGDALLKMFDQSITFNQVLGLKVLSLDGENVVTRFSMTPSLVGHYHYGRLHGGVISSVLDSTGGLGVMAAIGEKFKGETAEQVMLRFNRIGTIDLRVDFLRQGLGEYFDTTVKVIRLGGRIASAQMTLTNNLGELIATGAGSYVVS